MGKKSLKLTLRFVNFSLLVSACSCTVLIFLIPYFVMEMENFEDLIRSDIDETTEIVDRLWIETINTNQMRKPRSAYESKPSYSKYSTESYPEAKPPAVPYDIPKYGYGYRKIQCCCSTNGYDLSNLPVSYKCPMGPPGPKGKTGDSGEPGLPGRPGFDGEDANSLIRPPAVSNNAYSSPALPAYPLCEPCPAGPPGPPGPPGPNGYVGKKGLKGSGGSPGCPGKPGAYGEPGDSGQRGRRGVPGYKGSPGNDGVAGGKGLPGPKGPDGVAGVCGPRGTNGDPGEYGPPGLPGPEGPPGLAGHSGMAGSEGTPGKEGRPGNDAEYCPCPTKQYKPPSLSSYTTKLSSSYSSDTPAAIPPRPRYVNMYNPAPLHTQTTYYRNINNINRNIKQKRTRETLMTRFTEWPIRKLPFMPSSEKDYGLEREYPEQ